MAPTAIAWLEPTGASNASGRARFVERTSGVDLSVRVEGLAPGRHRIRLRAAAGCEAPLDASPGPLRSVRPVGADGVLEHRELVAGLDLDEDGPLVGGAVAIEAPTADDEPSEAAYELVACGEVEFLGLLAEGSEGRLQGPP